MRLLVLTLLALLSFNSYGKNQWHMVTFGRHGLGWSGSAERMNTNSDSSFKHIDNLISDFSLNYAYRISPRFQLGVFYEGLHNEYSFKTRNSGTSFQKRDSNTIGLFLFYNFHDDLSKAYYLGVSAGNTIYEEEISHDFADSEGKAALELDDVNQTYQLIMGKRIRISMMGFNNLSFSPQVRIFYQTHGKDFDDQNVDHGVGLSLQPIKFDLLF